VAWQTQEREPSGPPTKVPYAPRSGAKARADDPATWGTRPKAEARAARLPKPFGLGGVGIELGDLGDGRCIGGVDLDTCRNDAGTLAPWAAEVVALCNSYCEISPSGSGVKVFFSYPAADLAAIRAAMGTLHGKVWKQPGDAEHPPAIELHVGNRYFAVTDRHVAGTPIELRSIALDTLLRLIREVGPAFVGTGQSRAKNETHRDNSRSAIAFRKGLALRRDGVTFGGMCAALGTDPEAADWVREKGLPNGSRELHRIWDAGTSSTVRANSRTMDRERLLIKPADLPESAERLRDHLARVPHLFDRGVPVRLMTDQRIGGKVAHALGCDGVVREAHRVVQPWKFVKAGEAMEAADITLPDRVARLYLDMRGEWQLRPLNGIASAPLLRDDGRIFVAEGYDAETGIWCERVPDVAGLVSDAPTRGQAAAALLTLRHRFRTFPFADADMVDTPDLPVPVVNTATPPGADESAFLCGLLTAICRASIPLAPALLLRAAPMSGAGAGKGLLARCICAIAFGREPHAVTGGGTPEELEKRIAAELIAGGPVLFLDNLNAPAFKSDLLASAITERPARVRLLGKSEMMPLNSTAFVVLTGNGLSVSEDLARRFLTVELDPRCEDPEARPFVGDVLAEVNAQRPELLAAALTVWRWGRTATDMQAGRALGSFADWCRWVRDPLLALGCTDPAARVGEAKARDTRRQAVGELFAAWWVLHHDFPMAAKDLGDDVRRIADPQGRGRQFLASYLDKLTGTRIAGFVLTRQAPAGKWGVATYALKKSESKAEGHRDHRGHRAVGGGDIRYATNPSDESELNGGVAGDPMPPMPPMPFGSALGLAEGEI
jgi:hypothetical protein